MVGEDPLCSAKPGQESPTTGLNETFSTIAAVGIIGKLCQELGEKKKIVCLGLLPAEQVSLTAAIAMDSE